MSSRVGGVGEWLGLLLVVWDASTGLGPLLMQRQGGEICCWSVYPAVSTAG